MDRIDLNQLLDGRTMMLILQGIISLEGLHLLRRKETQELRPVATAIWNFQIASRDWNRNV
jgi:hypothetical protein